MTSLEARRAGRALFQATQHQGIARQTLDGLHAFTALLDSHGELRDAVMSVFVPPAAKRAIVEQVADAIGAPPAARTLLTILADTRHADDLPAIVREFETLVHREERRVDVDVTTAVAIDEGQTSRLQDALAQALGSRVAITTKVDPAVIGGAITRVGSLVYDGSLARQLARLKEQIAQQG
ncbi:MAG: ATP synthase F1 subunit delta [Acidobacteria bacterium]|nr:ATP synthase F1 subunit delta [Acidobacteriota bacterium]